MIANRFKTEKLIGQGSFSAVYSGTDSESNNPVAIKIFSKQLKAFFKIESEVLFHISKEKKFPKLIWSGESDNQYYIVMTLLGPSLSSRLSSNVYALSEICHLGQQIVKALEQLHKNCFIHRDLKPENIVSGTKNPKSYFLIDFGLAKKFWNNSFHNPMKSAVNLKAI